LPNPLLKQLSTQAERKGSLKARMRKTRESERKMFAARAAKSQGRMFAEAKVNIKVVTSRGKRYSQNWVYLPAALIHNPKFPFAPDEQVLVVIDEKGQRLIIEKLRPQSAI